MEPDEEESIEAEEAPPPCDRKGCKNAAAWVPVLLLRPRGYEGAPARAVIGLKVCAEHREKLPDPFITEEGWKSILSAFDAAGRARPHRILTEVEYRPLGATLPEGVTLQ